MVKKIDSVKSLKNSYFLCLLSIIYNFAAGLVSIWFGPSNRSLAISGFAIDSFAEVIYGIGIIHLIGRIEKDHSIAMRDKFENSVLLISGILFYLVTVGLLIGAGGVFYASVYPFTTKAGIIIAAISIAFHYGMYKIKHKTGIAFHSTPVITDAEWSRACYYLSIVLLGSCLAFELANVTYIDLVGGLGIAWFAYQGGKEALGKIKNTSILFVAEEKDESTN